MIIKMKLEGVISILGMILNDLVKGREELEIKGRNKTIQTTYLLTLRRVLETWGDLLSNTGEVLSTNAGVKRRRNSKVWGGIC